MEVRGGDCRLVGGLDGLLDHADALMLGGDEHF